VVLVLLSFGTASFGASINILTGVNENDPFVELQTNGGSFNTWGASAKFATGLIKDNWYLEVDYLINILMDILTELGLILILLIYLVVIMVKILS